MGNYRKAHPVARSVSSPDGRGRRRPASPAADPPDEAEQEPIEPYYFLQEKLHRRARHP
jgi:hypothetical protein